MSSSTYGFNDDQRVVTSRRMVMDSAKTDGGTDKTSEKLALKLEELKVGEKIRQAWFKGNADREEWMERQQDYLSSWDEFVVSTSTGAFTGSSTLHLPLPFIVVRAVYSRFVQALLGSDPRIKARRADSVDREQLVLDVMKYALNDWANWGQGVEEEACKYVWDGITTGSGYLKLRWDLRYERFVQTREEFEPGVAEIHEDENGDVSLKPTQKKVIVEETVEKKCHDCPVVWRRQHEDLLVLGGEGDPQRADLTIDRDFLTADETWNLIDRKIFRSDNAQAMIKAGPTKVTGARGADIKTDRAMNAGQASADDANVEARYEVLEAYTGIDIEGDGINSQVVVWVSPQTGGILRAAYLYNLSKSGRRPIFKWDFHKRPGAQMGVGLVEMIYPLSVEMDAMHNMRIDAGLLTTIPFGFYRPNSNIDQTEQELAPGKLIPVDNPQSDIYFPNFSNRTAFGFQEEQGLNTWVERMTSTNDLTFGAISGSQGPTRTARGVSAVQSESQSNLMAHFRNLRRSWKHVLRAMFELVQKRLPPGLEFAVTGEHGDRYFVQVQERDALYGDFDFEIDAPDPAGNQREAMAAEALQNTANPLDMQLGLVTASNRYEALKDYYKARGVKDFHRYVTRPAEYNLTLTPEEELNRVLRGIEVPITPQMDHEGFLKLVQEVMNDDHLLGQFSEQEASLLYVQAQKHAQAMQAVMAQQAQAANQQQVGINQGLGQA